MTGPVHRQTSTAQDRSAVSCFAYSPDQVVRIRKTHGESTIRGVVQIIAGRAFVGEGADGLVRRLLAVRVGWVPVVGVGGLDVGQLNGSELVGPCLGEGRGGGSGSAGGIVGGEVCADHVCVSMRGTGQQLKGVIAFLLNTGGERVTMGIFRLTSGMQSGKGVKQGAPLFGEEPNRSANKSRSKTHWGPRGSEQPA